MTRVLLNVSYFPFHIWHFRFEKKERKEETRNNIDLLNLIDAGLPII